MEVDGMNVVAGVAHGDPIAAALTEMEHRLQLIHHSIADRGAASIRPPVNGPHVKAAIRRVLLCKRHRDGFIGYRSRGCGTPKTSIIPNRLRGADRKSV